MAKRRERNRAPAEPVAAPPAPRPPRQPGLPFAVAALLLLGVAVALYWASLRHPLVFDDVHNLRDYSFKTFYAQAVSRFGLRWLSDASFGFVHALVGKNIFWQRLANVLMHAGVALVLYGFFVRLFRAVLDDPRARWMALAGALLFVVHPVAVYGVAYLIERSIVMATLFSVISLWCVLEGLLRRSAWWYAGAAVAYVLAVSSKEHAVMVPAVAGAMAVLVHGISATLARRIAVALVLFAAVGVVAVLKLRWLLGTTYEPFASDMFAHLSRGGDFDRELAYPLSVLNQATLFFRYLATWLVPWTGWMSVDVRTVFPVNLAQWQYWAGFAAWVVYPFAAAWLLLKRGRLGLVGFALLWPWLFALTEMVTVRVQEPFVLYRSYLWMAGLPALVPAVAGAVRPRLSAALFAAVVAGFTLAALDRLDSFSSPFKLWTDVIEKNTDARAPHVERGYIARGYLYFDTGQMKEADADFTRALEINPRSPDAHLAHGSLHLQRGELEAALNDMSRAIELDPRYASAYDKRCAVKIGMNQPENAIVDCEKALELDPKNHEAWINAGVVYHRFLKRPEAAAAAYARALRLEPNNGIAHFNFGLLLYENGRRDDLVRQHIVKACMGGVQQACQLAAGKAPATLPPPGTLKPPGALAPSPPKPPVK